MSTIAVSVKSTTEPMVGFVCRAGGMIYYAPLEGGLYTDDWRELLPASDYQATDQASARWLVRRAMKVQHDGR